MWVHGFRFSFTPLAGVLFAFPSRYFFSIGRISYLAFDRGRPGFRQGFPCPAVLRYRQRSPHHFAYGAFTLLSRLSQNLSAIMKFSPTPPLAGRRPYNPQHLFLYTTLLVPLACLCTKIGAGFRLFRFRSPLLPKSLLFSLPGVLRWFSSPSLASCAYFIHRRIPESLPVGYPIRLPTDLRMCAPRRQFSQLATAFLASIRQGIHHKPSSRLTILSFR